MNRLIGVLSALLVSLVLLVPAAMAAEPWSWDGPLDRAEHFLFSSGTNVVLPADQEVGVLFVFDGHTRVEGSAQTILVFNGSVELAGGQADTIVAVSSQVLLDATSVVSGEVRTRDSEVVQAPGASVGLVRDLGPDMALGWTSSGSVLLLIYVAFAVSAIGAGLIVAALAPRQVRAASALIVREPVLTVVAAMAGLVGLIALATLALITVVGIPLGLALLLLALPGLLIAGYLVAGISLGDEIVGRMAPGVDRARPYLAAVIGLTITGAISVFPVVGGLVSLVGMGAISLQLWRVLRRGRSALAADTGTHLTPALS